LKTDGGCSGLQKVEDNESSRQGCVAAKLHFRLRCKPSQTVLVLFSDTETCLGEIILCGNRQHGSVVHPLVEWADGRRIPREDAIGEGIDLEESYLHDELILSVLALFRLKNTQSEVVNCAPANPQLRFPVSRL
jgi:hypothetical protein